MEGILMVPVMLVALWVFARTAQASRRHGTTMAFQPAIIMIGLLVLIIVRVGSM